MFRILKFLLIFAIIIAGVSWLINNNGEVVINWLGYEIVTDIFMIIALSILSLIFIFLITYLLTKIFSFKISSITAKFVDRSNAKKLERERKDREVAYQCLTKVLAYLDEHEIKMARKFYKKFRGVVNNEEIIEYLDFRFKYFESGSYQKGLQKKTSNTPGGSPDMGGDDDYFNFTKRKGWSK